MSYRITTPLDYKLSDLTSDSPHRIREQKWLFRVHVFSKYKLNHSSHGSVQMHERNGRHKVHNIFTCIFLKVDVGIFGTDFFVAKGPICDKSALFRLMVLWTNIDHGVWGHMASIAQDEYADTFGGCKVSHDSFKFLWLLIMNYFGFLITWRCSNSMKYVDNIYGVRRRINNIKLRC